MVSTGNAEPAEAERPPWHWVAIGVAAIFLVWLPLAYLVRTMLDRLGALPDEAPPSRLDQIAIVGLNLLAFALASLAGGLLIGRFGGLAGLREATFAGLAVALLAWGIGLQGAPMNAWIAALLLALLTLVSAGSARLGGWLGLRRRTP